MFDDPLDTSLAVRPLSGRPSSHLAMQIRGIKPGNDEQKVTARALPRLTVL
jgi:hypothetical protein